jgi:hypothetical protein
MLLKKLTCLLLTLVFSCSLAVPAVLAGDTTPPGGGGEIHPWDNSDGHNYSGGPTEVYRRPVIIIAGYDFFTGGMYSIALSWPSRWQRTSTESSVQVVRIRATPRTVNLRTNTNW